MKENKVHFFKITTKGNSIKDKLMRKLTYLGICFTVLAYVQCANPGSKENNQTNENSPPKEIVAPTPPMGWNSFDAYDCRINEEQYRAIVDYMAENLLE